MSEKIVGNIEITLNLTDRRGIRITRYITEDDDKAKVNANCDEMQDILDRQFAKSDILTKEMQVYGMEQNILRQEQQVRALEAKDRLSSTDKVNLENLRRGLTDSREALKLHLEVIEAAKKRVGDAS